MRRPLEKKERTLGVKLFLKGERCNSPKCVMVRRPYPAGIHGKKRRGALSEYGQQLAENQKIKLSYGLRESQMGQIVKKALAKTGSTSEIILSILERRLNNVVFKLGFASSRAVARQLISHGHILVNGHKITAASYQVRIGDAISIKPSSQKLLIFQDLPNIIKKHETPEWLELDKEKLIGTVKSLPQNVRVPFDINLVVDYYSK